MVLSPVRGCMTLILVSNPNFSALAISASAAFMSLHFSKTQEYFYLLIGQLLVGDLVK